MGLQARSPLPRSRSRAGRASAHAAPPCWPRSPYALATPSQAARPRRRRASAQASLVVRPGRTSAQAAPPRRTRSPDRTGCARVPAALACAGLLRVLRAKDKHRYLTVGKLVLSINRGLAVAGPALAGTAAVAAAFIGTGDGASASGAAAACGALAAAVNTVEHGAQLGMLFELLRNCAGFYRKVQEDIEAALGEADVERRENGEVFRTKVALLLGRDAAELRQFRRMASASVKDDDIEDYAGKLF